MLKRASRRCRGSEQNVGKPRKGAVRRIAAVLSDGADAFARARYAGYRDAC